MRGWPTLLVGLASCGRIAFDGSPIVDDASPDAPGLPERLVCGATQVRVGRVADGTDLAVHWETKRITAMWAAPGGALQRMEIDDTTLVAGEPVVVDMEPVDAIAGVTRIAGSLVFATRLGNLQALWQLGEGLRLIRSESRVIAREPIVTDSTGLSRAWVRGDANGLVTSYLDPTGTIGADRPFQTLPIISIAAADQESHTHLSWSEDNAGVPECYQSDLALIPNAPQVSGKDLVGTDCFTPRIDSGPGPVDAIFTVWRTTPRTIEARYHGGVFDRATQLALQGRAPKVRYDGTRFWAAWIDEAGSGAIRLAAIEPELTFSTVDLTGWTVAGDEAFELVRVGSTVYLVTIGAESLTLFKTCF